MQERTNSELDVATMVMLLDYGMSLKDIAECFKLETKTVERLIVEHQRSRASGPYKWDPELYTRRPSRCLFLSSRSMASRTSCGAVRSSRSAGALRDAHCVSPIHMAVLIFFLAATWFAAYDDHLVLWCTENDWANSSLPIACRDSTYCVPRSKEVAGHRTNTTFSD